MSFYHLFIVNLKMLYRNWRGLFFTIALPVFLYLGLGLLNVQMGTGGQGPVNYSQYLLPGMIAVTIMQTGIFGLAYWLIDLRERGVLKRFKVTPLSNVELIGSLIATRLILMLIQIALLTSIGIWKFGVQINGSLFGIIFLMLLGGVIFLSFGFLISSIASTYEEAAPLTTVLNLIFTFLGNIFFPTEVFPGVLRFIGSKLPITYLANGMRHNFIDNWTLRQTLPDILSLTIWVCIVFGVTVYTFKVRQEN